MLSESHWPPGSRFFFLFFSRRGRKKSLYTFLIFGMEMRMKRRENAFLTRRVMGRAGQKLACA